MADDQPTNYLDGQLVHDFTVNEWMTALNGKSTFVGTPASQGAMLALTADTGDFCYRTDVSDIYHLTAQPPNILGNWHNPLSGNAASATKLLTARNINGVPFDGTASITVVDSTAEKTVNKNVANGYAGLDSGGHVPAALLPSYVDDVAEFANLAAFPGTGSAIVIYVAQDTGKVYRWSGSAYVEISPSPGSTDSVPEGSVNKYYTDARADARITAAHLVPWSGGTAGILPATSGQPLTTAGGNTLDDGSGHVAFIGGTLDNCTIGSTTPSPSVKTSTLLSPSTSVNWGAGNKPWINFGSAVFGNVTSGVPAINTFSFNDSINFTGSGFVYGLLFTHNVTSPAVGARLGIFSHVTANTTATQTLGQAEYIALGSRVETSLNLGGSNTTEAGSKGAHWGLWSFAALNSGATDQNLLFGAEIDVAVASGASVSSKIGLLVALGGGNATRGAVDDYALCLAKGAGAGAGTTGSFQYGLMLGTNRGAGGVTEGANWPFDTDSTLIGLGLPGTGGNPANIGMDLSNGTFTTASIIVPAAILPSTADTVDLGSAALYWDNIYVNTLAFEGSSPAITGNPALGTPASGDLSNCSFPTLNQSTTGNAATATKLATARNINGVPFDGTAAITVVDSTAEKTVNKNVANGYAGLDSGGKIPAALYPSSMDEVIEYANLAAFPGTGAAQTIYLALDTGKVYRWSGSVYVEISPSPGSTDSVTEGSTNLYYTNTRADARIAAAVGVTVQAHNANLDTISGLSPSDDDVVQRKSGSWTNRTMTQLKTDLSLANVDNTSDATKNSAVATLTNKTLTSPGITTPTGIVKGDVGLGNVDNTSNATERAATAALTHKDLTDATNTFPAILPTASGILHPVDYGWKYWNMPPMKANIANTLLTAGETYGCLIHVPKADTITNVIIIVGVAGASLTSGQCFAGLLDSGGNLLSATADQSTAWQSTGAKVMALSAAQSVAAGWYYVAWFGNGTTMPKLNFDAQINASVGLAGSSLSSTPPTILDITHTGLTTAFHAPTSLSVGGAGYFAGVS